MKAGDIKRFLEKLISTEDRVAINPKDFNINDNFLLGAIGAYKRGEPATHIQALVQGYMETEDLTTRRRLAVLKLVRDVVMGLSAPDLTKEDRQRLRELLTAYYI